MSLHCFTDIVLIEYHYNRGYQLSIINLYLYNKEKDLEIPALKLHFMSTLFIVVCIYRSPMGDFCYFLNQLDLILNKLHKMSNEIILCGDFNINYANDNSRKDLLNSLLASFNLFSTINFPMRISNKSCT
jgi:exonuclease III